MDRIISDDEEKLVKIIENYKLNKNDLIKLKRIKNHIITSVAYTAYGGFNKRNGEFYVEDRKINYRLRIKYRPRNGTREKILLLKKVKETSVGNKPFRISQNLSLRARRMQLSRN